MSTNTSNELAELYTSAAAPYLSGESHVAHTPARRTPPFLLRILPFSQLLLFPLYKNFLLVCTPKRVVVLLLKTMALKPTVIREFASIPHEQISGALARGGDLIIQTKTGTRHRFRSVLFSDFDGLVSAITRFNR